MKRFAYIELDTHAELANNFYELTKDFETVSVDFYFSEKIFQLLNIHNKNVFQTGQSQLLELLEKQNYALIIIGTVHRHFNFYKLIVDRFKTAILVHNLNFTKATKWVFFKSVFKRDFTYRLKLLFKESLLDAPRIYQMSKYLLGIDASISEKNHLEFLPLFFNQFEEQKPEKENITIIIPGAVSQARRDYKSTLEKLKNFKNIGIQYEVILLGKASGKELENLKSSIKQLPEFIKVQFFEHKIPQQAFDDWMLTADVLYCPIQSNTDFFSIPEIYGQTKISGNIGDAIKYGKPAIFPAIYKSDSEFILQEKPDLQTQFLEVMTARYNFSNFSRKKISEAVSDVLLYKLT